MKMTLCVRVEGRFGEYVACKDLPEYQQECFEPLGTCDDALVAMATGDELVGSQVARTVVKTREDTAKSLAAELVPIIVEAMKKRDTHNGYKI